MTSKRKSKLEANIWSFQNDHVPTKLDVSGHPTTTHKDKTKSLGYVVVSIERGSGFNINLDLSIEDAKLLVEKLQAALVKTEPILCTRSACWNCEKVAKP